ncbi:MAG TPA: acyltransferase [Flavobacterium sp.]|uniref:acyltransferase n=1 Tax=Flavobacterium sp. TaxID=239 RepID=UPI002B4B79D3|nr:acyltransferase [Flavobacterium sp.]HLO73465.1 acyltransferase [Flavobacterium sp.]
MGILHQLKQFAFVNLRIFKYKSLSSCQQVLGQPKLYHPLLLNGKGKISFGKNVQIGVLNSPKYYTHYSYFEARNLESEIIIGNNVTINNNCSIEALLKITIQDDVLIGINCAILDNDGHDLTIDKRLSGIPKSEEIIIEKNVFIGDNVTILKGVTIGENSVIGNGAIVTKNIPANVIAVGNPVKIIKEI